MRSPPRSLHAVRVHGNRPTITHAARPAPAPARCTSGSGICVVEGTKIALPLKASYRILQASPPNIVMDTPSGRSADCLRCSRNRMAATSVVSAESMPDRPRYVSIFGSPPKSTTGMSASERSNENRKLAGDLRSAHAPSTTNITTSQNKCLPDQCVRWHVNRRQNCPCLKAPASYCNISAPPGTNAITTESPAIASVIQGPERSGLGIRCENDMINSLLRGMPLWITSCRELWLSMHRRLSGAAQARRLCHTVLG